jgi:hypothetical protein
MMGKFTQHAHRSLATAERGWPLHFPASWLLLVSKTATTAARLTTLPGTARRRTPVAESVGLQRLSRHRPLRQTTPVSPRPRPGRFGVSVLGGLLVGELWEAKMNHTLLRAVFVRAAQLCKATPVLDIALHRSSFPQNTRMLHDRRTFGTPYSGLG